MATAVGAARMAVVAVLLFVAELLAASTGCALVATSISPGEGATLIAGSTTVCTGLPFASALARPAAALDGREVENGLAMAFSPENIAPGTDCRSALCRAAKGSGDLAIRAMADGASGSAVAAVATAGLGKPSEALPCAC